MMATVIVSIQPGSGNLTEKSSGTDHKAKFAWPADSK